MSSSVRSCVNHLVEYHQITSDPSVVKVSPTYNRICYPSGWGYYPSYIPCFPTSQQERDEQRQTSAAFLGGIAMISLAGLSAYALKAYRIDRQELAVARFDLKRLGSHWTPENAPLRSILHKHIEILEAKCARARHITFFVVGLLAAATAAFVGGMFAMNGLITASIVAGVALATIGAFQLVWHYDEDYSLPPAMQQELLKLADSKL